MITDSDRDRLADAIINAVRDVSMKPSNTSYSVYGTLSTCASKATEGDFWNTNVHSKTRRWVGRPVVTVRGSRDKRGNDWKASVYEDKNGKATVLVPKGITILEVDHL